MSTSYLVIGAVGIATLLTACSGSSGQQGQEGSQSFAEDATFTMAVKQDFGTYDPYGNPNVLSYTPFAYDSLVNLTSQGKFVSGLAEKWTVDAKSATFTLKKGVTCSDGTPLTAAQIATVINYAGDPKNKSSLAGVRIPPVALSAAGDDAAGVVKVTLEEPHGFLLHTIGQIPITCAKNLADRQQFATKANGTGPYTLDSVVPGDSFTFTRRTDYTWGPDGADTKAPGMPAKVVIKVIEDETTRANLLLSGELNMAQIQGGDAQRLDAAQLKRLPHPMAGTWFRFNENDGRPTADQRVRRALLQGANIPELVKVSTGGKGEAATGMVTLEPKPCAGDSATGVVPTQDVAAAGAALDAAGWKRGADGIRAKDGKPLAIDIHYLADWSVFNAATAELLGRQWQQLGVRTKLSSETLVGLTSTFFETRNWDVQIDGQGMSLPTQVVPWYSGPQPPDGKNVGGVDNKEFASLATQAKSLPDAQACDYWTRAEQALFRNADVLPISKRFEYLYLQKASAEKAAQVPALPTTIRVYR